MGTSENHRILGVMDHHSRGDGNVMDPFQITISAEDKARTAPLTEVSLWT